MKEKCKNKKKEFRLDHKMLTLDWALNWLAIQRFGQYISFRLCEDRINIYWWDGTCSKGSWRFVGKGKLKITAELPSPAQVERKIKRLIKIQKVKA